MAKLQMFEIPPEGFRLVTDGPTKMKLVALTIGQAFAESPYFLPLIECPFGARLKLWYAMGEGYVNTPSSTATSSPTMIIPPLCRYMLRRCNI